MKPVIVTNNPKVIESYKELCKIVFIEGEYMDVLIAVRDYIHKGHELLTHPLSGSIKPNETPYKSALISSDVGQMNISSTTIIEDSILTAKKFIENKKTPLWTESILEDFSEIDFRLLESAMGSIGL
ncbi:hypothetical protein SAMN05660297_03535 [Natronincola peptidivorans]|uniref:GrdX protein n=1 Tax=Natronincola peptidivorans TaxID=426128 RepID=A0A1I0H7P3_9FIRM|nr:GrdX family protein [Natronincola peptidivorans]SET79617.1 hypothetical protein SAMN05660297_03535 [Natronincola peptidivorans]